MSAAEGGSKVVEDEASTVDESFSNASSGGDEFGECFVCLDENNLAPLSQCKCVGRYLHLECQRRLAEESGKDKCSVCLRDRRTDRRTMMSQPSRVVRALARECRSLWVHTWFAAAAAAER